MIPALNVTDRSMIFSGTRSSPNPWRWLTTATAQLTGFYAVGVGRRKSEEWITSIEHIDGLPISAGRAE
jgi:hypothetical protein